MTNSRYTALNRYSQWDGSQKRDLHAAAILAEISEDLMEFGDLQQALRYLMQRGMDGDEGSTLRGLREMLKQLKEQRRDRLERYDMGSILDDIREQLEDILRMEQETIDEWVDRKAPDGLSLIHI